MKKISLNVYCKIIFILIFTLIIIYVYGYYYLALKNDGYKYTIYIPIIFVLFFSIFIWKPLFKYKTPYIITFSIVLFLKYYIYPLSVIINGTYDGMAVTPPSVENLQFSSFLMVYELFFISIVFNIFSNVFLKDSKRKCIKINSNNVFYIIIFIFSLILILLIPSARKGINFFLDVERSFDNNLSPLILLIRHLFVISKYFLFFYITSKLYNKKIFKNELISYLIIVICALFLMSIHVGLNRKNIISDAFAFLVIILVIFPKRKRLTISIITLFSSLLFISFTIVKANLTDVINYVSNFFSLAHLQPYLLGEYNIAIAIEAKEFFVNEIGIKNLFMDIFRPIIGIGEFLKESNILRSSEMFSIRFSYGSSYRDDQIIPLIGQGYLYFGFLLSPIFSIVWVILGLLCDKIFIKSSRLEYIFLSSYFAINIAQAISLNNSILINIISLRVVIIIPILLINKIFNEREKLLL